MQLSDFSHLGKVLNNADFSSVGHIVDPFEKMLVYAGQEKWIKEIVCRDNISAVVTTENLAPLLGKKKTLGVLIAENPRDIFYQIHESRVDNSAVASRAPKFGDNCTIDELATVLPGAEIGDRVVVRAGAIIGSNVRIGDDTFIDYGAIVGAEGLLNFNDNGSRRRVRHAGGVEVGARCVILSQAVLVRAIHEGGFTRVGDETTVGIGVNLGHDALMGRQNTILGNTFVGGRVRTGNSVWIGMGATIRDNLNLGDNCQVMAGSCVISDVKEGEIVSGNFAFNHRRHLRSYCRSL